MSIIKKIYKPIVYFQRVDESMFTQKLNQSTAEDDELFDLVHWDLVRVLAHSNQHSGKRLFRIWCDDKPNLDLFSSNRNRAELAEKFRCAIANKWQ